MDKQIHYLRSCLPAAEKAGQVFHMNPLVILAQGALESGWGTSSLATEHHNYFGIMGYGAANDYWYGAVTDVKGPHGTLRFRHYASPELSFLDFARLIFTGYPRAWSFSQRPEAYAKEIAYSPYISEQNGDNREQYRRNVVAITQKVASLRDMYDWVQGEVA